MYDKKRDWWGLRHPRERKKISKEEREGGSLWKKQKRKRDGEEGPQAVGAGSVFVMFPTLLERMKDGLHPLL